MNSEVWLRAQYQTVIKERDQLQSKLKYMERENQDLRKSVFELSYQLSQLTPSSLFQIPRKLGESNWKPVALLQQQGQHSYQHGNANSNNQQDPQMSQTSPMKTLDGGDQQAQQQALQQVVLPLVPPPPQLDLIINHNDDKRSIAYETEIRGHAGAVYCSDISADNRYLATGSFDKTIIIWDVTFPYKMRCCLNGHTQLVSDVCWALTTPWSSSMGHSKGEDRKSKDTMACKYLLYSVSFDKTMRIWDPESKTCLSVIKLKGLGTSLNPCMPCSNFPMGFMVATTSTQYIYIVENSTVLLNQHNSEEGGDVTEGVGGGAVREGNPVVLITEGSSSSGSNSGVVPPQGGRHDVGSGAVFYKHAHVATSAVCYVDPQHGSGVFLGDVSGCISFYKIGSSSLQQPDTDPTNGGNSMEPPMLPAPPIPMPVPTSLLLTPAILGQQSLYTTHFHSSFRRDNNTDFRLLDMKLCGKGQANVLPSHPPPMKHHPTQQQASQAHPPPRVPHRDTLLAVQCSDHCIRLYAVGSIMVVLADSSGVTDCLPPLLHQRSVSGGSTGSLHSTKSMYSQADTVDFNDGTEKVSFNTLLASDFLRPIRILEGHATGEWSIKMNFVCGDRYPVHLPPPLRATDDAMSNGKMSGVSGKSGNSHRQLHMSNSNSGLLNLEGKAQQQQTAKAAYRNIIPVDSGGGAGTGAGTGAGAGGGGSSTGVVGGGNSVLTSTTVTGLDIPALMDRSYHDRSRSAEASPRGRRSRSQSRGSSVSDDKEYDSYYEREKGSDGGDHKEGEENEDDDEDHDSLLDGDDDENDLSMVAGLVSSQLMTTDDAVLLGDDEVLDRLDPDSMTLAGAAGLSEGGRLHTVLEQQRLLGVNGRRLAQATEWETSLMLATGCSKGKVFIYDISTLSHPDTGRSSSGEGSHKHNLQHTTLNSQNHNKTASSFVPSSMVWKVLHAQSSGKSYGVSISKNNTAILTYGSESSLKAWSLSNSNDVNK